MAIGILNVATLGVLPLLWLPDTGRWVCPLQSDELFLDSLTSSREGPS